MMMLTFMSQFVNIALLSLVARADFNYFPGLPDNNSESNMLNNKYTDVNKTWYVY